MFTAIENANAAGKYAIKHASVYVVKENPANTFKWNSITGDVYLGYGGSLDDLKLTSSDKIAWGKFSLGTAVDVKTLVTGKYVVNILVSANKETSEMRSVIYSKQAAASAGKATPVISGSTESTDFYKDAVHAQWVVSANADNTVTFINRETNAKIENVTLFKTPKANVYTTSSVALTDDKTSPTSINLNSVFVELRKVDNTTQWDGFLKLDEEGLNTEYTLSVDNSTTFEEIEANLIADDDTSTIIMTNDVTVPALTFKLAQSKSEVGLNETKLDTLMVNPIVFKYYKDGELTEVKDTLKAIKYNFVSLVNTGKKVVKADFGLADNTGTSGKFVFRKNGDRYQIANNKGYEDYTFVQYDKTNKIFELTSTTGDDSGITDAASFSLNPVAVAPSYDVPESHIALQINGAYLGAKADGNAIMTNDTLMLKSTVADAAFSFYAFSADKEEAKTPSYYLSSNGMMMYSPANEIAAINKEISELSPVFDAEEIAELEAKRDAYMVNGENLVKFQRAKYEAADKVALADTTYTKDDDLKPFKFNVLDVDGQAVLKNAASGYVKAINDVVVFTSSIDNAAKFDVVAAEAPTSNESVSASEVKVIANNGSINVKNAAGKNVVVSTILGQVVANEVLTSDNATINVPAGIVVVAVEGESFKVNVK